MTSFPTNILFYFCVIFESCAHTEILVVTVSAHEILLNSIACKLLPYGHDIFGDESGMATLGRVEEFDGNRDDWQQYVERLKHFFVANSIDGAEKKRAVFLSVIGLATYKTLRNLLSPGKPGDRS